MSTSFHRSVQFAMMMGILLGLVRCGSGSGGAAASSGKAGSTARFAILGDRLFTLSGREEKEDERSVYHPILRVFDVSEPSTPKVSADVDTLPFAETLFTDGRRIYVGSESGMGVYDTQDPDHPSLVATVAHARACDPVVVDGDRAYVTLRSAITCIGGVNALHVIDLSDPALANQIASFPMNAPWGLAAANGRVYVCDGPAGLRVLDVAEATAIKDLPGVPEEICTDMILDSGKLVVTGFSGIAQYDVSAEPPRKLSLIAVSSAP